MVLTLHSWNFPIIIGTFQLYAGIFGIFQKYLELSIYFGVVLTFTIVCRLFFWIWLCVSDVFLHFLGCVGCYSANIVLMWNVYIRHICVISFGGQSFSISSVYKRLCNVAESIDPFFDRVGRDLERPWRMFLTRFSWTHLVPSKKISYGFSFAEIAVRLGAPFFWHLLLWCKHFAI